MDADANLLVFLAAAPGAATLSRHAAQPRRLESITKYSRLFGLCSVFDGCGR
jgi:hypothetical protein